MIVACGCTKSEQSFEKILNTSNAASDVMFAHVKSKKCCACNWNPEADSDVTDIKSSTGISDVNIPSGRENVRHISLSAAWRETRMLDLMCKMIVAKRIGAAFSYSLRKFSLDWKTFPIARINGDETCPHSLNVFLKILRRSDLFC